MTSPHAGESRYKRLTTIGDKNEKIIPYEFDHWYLSVLLHWHE